MTETSSRLWRVLVVSLLGALASLTLFGFGVASAADIEASNSTVDWSPDTATIDAGESVSFKNSSASVNHGVGFDAPPATPSCSGVPTTGTSWEGNCTFSQAGE